MTFSDLKKFITEDMSMSHIYQPVMLIELLKNQGSASEEDIAKVILTRDPTQLEYYIDSTASSNCLYSLAVYPGNTSHEIKEA